MILMNPDPPERSRRKVPAFHEETSEEVGLDSFLGEIMDHFLSEIRETLPSFKSAIVTSGNSFLSDSRRDLERWTRLLASGSISEDEFQWLVQARVHLAEMSGLTQAGLSLARIDEIRQSLVQSITGAAFKFIGL